MDLVTKFVLSGCQCKGDKDNAVSAVHFIRGAFQQQGKVEHFSYAYK